MNTDNQFILDTLSTTEKLYLKSGSASCKNAFKDNDIPLNFMALYRIDEITFEDEAPRKEALENVISSINIEGVNFIYIIMGDSLGVSFYYGVAQDFSYNGKTPLTISDIGEGILKPSLQGNFRGSRITELDANAKKSLYKQINSMPKVKIIEGVPGINKDDESFQSVDRIIDVMLGDSFALMLIAKPISAAKISETQEKAYQFYDMISPSSKISMQESRGTNESTSNAGTTGSNQTSSTNNSVSKQENSGQSSSRTVGESGGSSKGTTRGTSKNNSSSSSSESGHEDTNKGWNTSDSNSTTTGKSTTLTEGSSDSHGTSESTTKTIQKGINSGSAKTSELVNKKVQDWLKYIDEVILPRIDYGSGKGLFVSSAFILGNDEAALIKLENTIRSIYGGESGNKMPLRAFNLTTNEISFVKKMQLPNITYPAPITTTENTIRTVCSQLFADNTTAVLGNWMSSKEISLFAGLPQKEVVGLALREEVEFGLNRATNEENPILLGHLIQSGIVLDGKNRAPNIYVCFDKTYFDKHIFVTGVTGSGKTTTCQKLLLESKNNFMVIEPAKTEYRILSHTFNDLLVFTLGKENGAPFRLNPFEFFPGENITSRVDMIKASMEAAFDMEAAIPQILETAIYSCYEDKGWDFSTNKNTKYDDPFADGVFAFPTLGDLDQKIEQVVKEQGFSDRLHDEYVGSIRARLKGLLVGSKGLMLNTPRSLNFVELLDKKVILELENIKSASEKSLIMGFILGNLSEAIKIKYNQDKKQLDHLTLIEEAHRLLSKYMPGDSMNKKQGVEMFSDMLAEVRKYGESLIIADQIPNKLTPEVLKNTNTKIVHKIFAQDDKEAIGNTMALKEEQKEHLSYLEAGRAIMINPGLSKAIQIKISQTEDNDTKRIPPNDDELRELIIQYYSSIYKTGVLVGLENLDVAPTKEMLLVYLEYLQPNGSFIQNYHEDIKKKRNIKNTFIKTLEEMLEKISLDDIATLMCSICHKKEYLHEYSIKQRIKEYFEIILKTGEGYNPGLYQHRNELDNTRK